MDKLQRLEQVISLLESDKVTRTEFTQLFDNFIKVVKELRNNIESKIDISLNESNTIVNDVVMNLNNLDIKVKELNSYVDFINKKEVDDSKGREAIIQVKELSQRLSSEVSRLEKLIPLVPEYDIDISNLKELIKNIHVENGESIIDKINSLPEDDESLKIDASHIKNLPKTERIIQNSGGGASMVRILNNGATIGDTVTEINFTNATSITYTGGATGRRANITTGSSGGGGGGITISTPSETVNSVNTVYTVTAEPLYVVSDGVTYFDGAGYTYGALSITLSSPPTQYIRYAVGSGITIETPTGSVNSSNTSFTVTSTPKYIVSDGITYFENNGYTIVGLTVTMTSPPTQYIRSTY